MLEATCWWKSADGIDMARYDFSSNRMARFNLEP